jgi:hypothetical protein
VKKDCKVLKDSPGGTALKVGVVLNRSKPEPIDDFDMNLYFVKEVTGEVRRPLDGACNIVTCFNDNKAVAKDPGLAAISSQDRAVRGNERHHFLWDWICPTNETYRRTILDLIEETSRANIAGIRLDGVQFAGEEYCTCPRCKSRWGRSSLGWGEWKSSVITEFVEEVRAMVKGDLCILTDPDPCSTKDSYGLDYDALSRYVDCFMVPLLDTTYSAPYWVRILARCFRRQIKAPLYVQLYAANPGIPPLQNVVRAAKAVSEYVDGIVFETFDSPTARELRRMMGEKPV